MATTAKPKRQVKTDLSDVLTDAVRARQTPAVVLKPEQLSDPRYAEIAANPFFKVMFSDAAFSDWVRLPRRHANPLPARRFICQISMTVFRSSAAK